jgi:hypothetical protein
MSTTLTIERPVHFRRGGHGGRKELREGKAAPALPPGRVPRIARLMALAIRLEEQVRTGVVASYSEVAAVGHVTRARVSQIMNLVNLAPDIQEALLHLPRTESGRDVIHLRQLQPIASVLEWRTQRLLWAGLIAGRLGPAGQCAEADGNGAESNDH